MERGGRNQLQPFFWHANVAEPVGQLQREAQALYAIASVRAASSSLMPPVSMLMASDVEKTTEVASLLKQFFG